MLKRVAALLVVAAGSAALAEAQESYCITAQPAQVTRINDAITRSNASTCTRLNLAVGCTQGQACTAGNCTGGAACTPNQAQACNARIYDNTTQTGRQELVNELTKTGFLNMENAIKSFDNTTFCTNFKASTRTQKDAACTAVGYVPGCEPCI